MDVNLDTALSAATLVGLAALFWRMTRNIRDMRELAGRVSRLERPLEGLLHRNSAPKAAGE